MTSTTMNAVPAPTSMGARCKELVFGVAYLMFVGTAFTGVVALVSALFISH